jgi:cytochrome P450 family 628
MNQIHTFHARAVSFALGIAGHIFIFRRGEWDLYTVQIAVTFIGLHAATIAALLHYYPELAAHSLATVKAIFALGSSFVAGVFGSMLVYRGFFHRLCRFPGPFLARFSNFYPTYLSAKKLHLYEEVQQLHEQHGDFVRIGALPP